VRLATVAVLTLLTGFSYAQVPDPEWAEATARALREHKPLVVFFRPTQCPKCTDFERSILAHPAVERRMARIVFLNLPVLGNEPATQWNLRKPGFAVFDHAGALRVRWDGLPRDTTTLIARLDDAIAAAPHFEKAVELTRNGPHEGELELAFALAKFGRTEEARAAVERAIANGSAETRQLGLVGRAMLDLSDGKGAAAMLELQILVRDALTPEIAATAWNGIGLIHRTQGKLEDAIRAYAAAVELAGPDTESGASARKVLDQLRELAAAQPAGPIRIVPPAEQLVTGRRRIRTLVESAAVAKVVFSVDGTTRATVERPPFSTVIDFGRIPQAQTIRTLAFDARGKELGRAELTVNNAGETFWLRLTEPREGPASGALRVSATMRAPVAHQVKRVVVSWNDEQQTSLTAPPWQTQVKVPNEIGILRAVAELDDGRTAEDAVLLNASGYTDRSDVPLVELPVTIKGRPVKASDIVVREGSRKRVVESVTAGTDAPLTVGMLIDTSGSMHASMPDVQEAAIRFLETGLGPKDRAFLITFDSEARLVQIPTTDRTKLREQIIGLRPSGYTALHDATILGLLQFEGVKGRRALVVFSDGADRSSRYDAGDVQEMSRRSNIPIYMIAGAPEVTERDMRAPRQRGRPTARPPLNPTSAQWTLIIGDATRMIESTGGRLHRLFDLAELHDVYRQIAEDLRAQSLVEIRTDPGRSENDWRKIAVEIAGRADVRAPAGYYAPW
jgi:VWFA-related protein